MATTVKGATAAPRINRLPNFGAIVVPKELNACVRFKRLEAVRGGPRTVTYGLAEVCSTVMPAARTISAARNNGNDGREAAGTKRIAPVHTGSTRTTMER